MSKGTFVIVKAANCGMCVNRLEPLMPVIHKRFKSENIDIVEYKIDQMRVNKDKAGNPVYPDSLGMIWWYPFMFFIDNKTWELIKKGQDHRDKISIVNGNYNGDSYSLDESMPVNPFDPNILVNWAIEKSNILPSPSSLQSPPRTVKEVIVDSNPFLPQQGKKKNILEINYCNVKIVPRSGRS